MTNKYIIEIIFILAKYKQEIKLFKIKKLLIYLKNVY